MSKYEKIKIAHEQEYSEKVHELHRINAHRKAILKRINELELIMATLDAVKPEPVKTPDPGPTDISQDE